MNRLLAVVMVLAWVGGVGAEGGQWAEGEDYTGGSYYWPKSPPYPTSGETGENCFPTSGENWWSAGGDRMRRAGGIHVWVDEFLEPIENLSPQQLKSAVESTLRRAGIKVLYNGLGFSDR